MITAIVGKPGSGKSLQLVRLAVQFLRNGKDVYSNVAIDETKIKKNKKYGKLYKWSKMSEFANIYSGIVLWDEVGAYFDSRSYASFPEEVRIKFQQYRKDGLDIFYTVQSLNRADRIIKDLTNEVIECHNIYGIFWATRFYTEDYESVERGRRTHQGSYVYFGSKKLYSLYDTTQKINRAKHDFPHFELMSDYIKRTRGGDIT